MPKPYHALALRALAEHLKIEFHQVGPHVVYLDGDKLCGPFASLDAALSAALKGPHQ